MAGNDVDIDKFDSDSELVEVVTIEDSDEDDNIKDKDYEPPRKLKISPTVYRIVKRKSTSKVNLKQPTKLPKYLEVEQDVEKKIPISTICNDNNDKTVRAASVGKEIPNPVRILTRRQTIHQSMNVYKEDTIQPEPLKKITKGSGIDVEFKKAEFEENAKKPSPAKAPAIEKNPKRAKIGSRRKTVHQSLKLDENISFETYIVPNEKPFNEDTTEGKLDNKASKLNFPLSGKNSNIPWTKRVDYKNPNCELMKKVAFLRVCVNYMMLSLKNQPFEFKKTVSLPWLMSKYNKIR